MKRLRQISVVLIVTGFVLNIGLFIDTFSEKKTTTVFATTDGATIHPHIKENNYGKPIEGKFLINAPIGEYMLTSNVQGATFFQVIFLLAGLTFFYISTRAGNYTHNQDKS